MLIGDEILPALQAWLVEHLEPICVADPKVLGDYVIALLKKNEPRDLLLKTCIDELEDFLRDATSSFVHSLFDVLKEDKSGKVTLKIDSRRQRTPDDDDDDRDHKHRRGERERDSRRHNDYDGKRRREADDVRRPYEPYPKASRTYDNRDRDRDDRSRRRDDDRGRDRREPPPVRAEPPPRVEPPPAASAAAAALPPGHERVDKSIEDRLSQPLGTLVRRRDGAGPPPPRMVPGFPLPIGPNGAFVPPVLLPPPVPMVPLPIGSKSKRCEDYDTKGYCERGALCPYDHGYDFISTDATALESMRTKPASEPSYDPENPQVTAPAQKAAPKVSSVVPPHPPFQPLVGIPPIPMVGVQHPQLWRPPMPMDFAMQQAFQQQMARQHPANGPSFRPPETIGRGMFQDRPQISPQQIEANRRLLEGRIERPVERPDGRPRSANSDSEQTASPGAGAQIRPPRSYEQRERPPWKHRRASGPPAKDQESKTAETGDKAQAPAEQYDRNTLMVKNVPPELCTIEKFNEHFKKFGAIVNIQVKPEQKMGIVQYTELPGAKAAIRDPEAVFGNRFVRVHWANQPDRGAPGAPPVGAKPFMREGNSHTYKRPELATAAAAVPLTPKEMQKKKDDLRREQIATLTKLLSSMEKMKNVDPAEKAALKKRIVDLTNSVSTSLKKETAAAASPAGPLVSPSMSRAKPASPAPGGTPTTERLQKRLDSLKKIAESMGIDSAQALAPSPELARSTRGGAARGRGGAYSARGGRVGMGNSLDLRPTTLRVTGAPKAEADELRVHFEQFGDVLSYSAPGDDDESAAVVQFAVRWQAESAMSNGKLFKAYTLKLAWQQNPKPASSTPTPVPMSLSSSTADVSTAAGAAAAAETLASEAAPMQTDAAPEGDHAAEGEGGEAVEGEEDYDDEEGYEEGYHDELYQDEEGLDENLMLDITEEQLAAVGVDPADTVFEVSGSEDESDDPDAPTDAPAGGPDNGAKDAELPS
eukprot:TRINITY_DN3389_c0_g1_i1.p1 TRINITY_DN3389_c0_g1~~TRINITY_DN3389_c0_g1_i1.p1  ORF type:complete len:987 (-),score=217.63 TRINITY_DN3389_c0_g1_i1:331-3291(-)